MKNVNPHSYDNLVHYYGCCILRFYKIVIIQKFVTTITNKQNLTFFQENNCTIHNKEIFRENIKVPFDVNLYVNI